MKYLELNSKPNSFFYKKIAKFLAVVFAGLAIGFVESWVYSAAYFYLVLGWKIADLTSYSWKHPLYYLVVVSYPVFLGLDAARSPN